MEEALLQADLNEAKREFNFASARHGEAVRRRMNGDGLHKVEGNKS